MVLPCTVCATIIAEKIRLHMVPAEDWTFDDLVFDQIFGGYWEKVRWFCKLVRREPEIIAKIWLVMLRALCPRLGLFDGIANDILNM